MSLINLFSEEIEQIQDEKIRSFVVDVLHKVPEFYSNIEVYISETKKSFKYSNTFLETLSSSDYVDDIVKSAILIQDITRYRLEYEEDEDDITTKIVEDHMHPLNVRITVSPLLGMIGEDKFDDIMRTVESSHGLNSPIPQVTPSMQDPVHIWILPFCNSLARAY